MTFLGQKQCSNSQLGGDAIKHLMSLTYHLPAPRLYPKSDRWVQNSMVGWLQCVCPDFIDPSLSAFSRSDVIPFIKWYPCNTFMTTTDWQVTWGYWKEMGSILHLDKIKDAIIQWNWRQTLMGSFIEKLK